MTTGRGRTSTTSMGKAAALCAAAPLLFLFFPLAAQASVDFASVNLNPLSQGLVGYWPLDGDTTNWKTDTVADLSGNGNTGTMIFMSTTTSPTIGIIGEALKFSGSSQYITVPDIASSITNTITVSFWIKANGSSFAQDTALVAQEYTSGSSIKFAVMGDSDTGGSSNEMGAGFFSGGTWHTVNENGAFSFGKWTFVTASYDGSTLRLYINGILNSTTAISSTLGDSGLIWNIAKRWDTSGTGNVYFNGSLDDIRVYNRTLSSQEIQLLYALGNVKAGNTPQTNASAFNFGLSAGLVAYWPLDGNTTSWTTDTTKDVSGDNYTGTFVGMSTTSSPTIGKIGQALKFDGSSNYIATAYTVPAQSSSTSFTWSTWLKLAAGNPSNVVILGNRGGGGSTWIKLTPTAFEYNGGLISHTIPTGTWVQVTIVKNGTNFTYYQNGTVIGTASNSGSTSAYTFYMGEDPGYTGDGDLTGTLDDVRIYSRALSYQEVEDLYNEGKVAIGNSPTPTATSGIGLNAGLVGYWTFDGPETNWATGITQDSSGNGANGTMVNMGTTTSPTIGKIGQALNFNGTSSYINVPSFPTAHTTLSVSAWVYPTALSQSSFGSGTGGSIIDENEGGGSAGWDFGIKNNNALWFWPSGSNDKFSTGTVPLNTWTFVTATYDGTDIRFYINGALDSTQSMSTPQGSATFFKIGAESWTTGYWKGKLDDVRIYNRALSAQEIAQLYAAGH